MNISTNYNGLVEYDDVKEKFDEISRQISLNNGTTVHEVQSFNLKGINEIKKALMEIDQGDVVWQHLSIGDELVPWHKVAIFIRKGDGKRWNRKLLDLYASGVITLNDFDDAWARSNGDRRTGKIPTVGYSKTSSERVKQVSLIEAAGVPDLTRPRKVKFIENEDSKIPGRLAVNIPHRTHLISVQTTGIENNSGLLIDYDGWLNTVPMSKFENEILDMNESMDIVWTANVFKKNDGLHFRYSIYSSSFILLKEREWVDDRWTYSWHDRDYLKNIKKRHST